MEAPGTGGAVLKGTGVGGNGRKQQVGDRLGDRPMCGLEQAINQFTTRGVPGRNPVHIRISRITDVMVNIDENFAAVDASACLPQTIKTGTIGGHNTVELFAGLWLLPASLPVEE